MKLRNPKGDYELLLYANMKHTPPHITPIARSAINPPIGSTKESIMAGSFGPSFPSVKTESNPVPAKPANIIINIAPAPPTFIPIR